MPLGFTSRSSVSPQANLMADRRSSVSGMIKSPVPSAASWHFTFQRIFSLRFRVYYFLQVVR